MPPGGRTMAFAFESGQLRLAVGLQHGRRDPLRPQADRARRHWHRSRAAQPARKLRRPRRRRDRRRVKHLGSRRRHVQRQHRDRTSPAPSPKEQPDDAVELQVARGRADSASRTGSTPARRSTQREVERIFHGRTWNFVALEAEIPNPGDYKRSYVGPTPVVVARDDRRLASTCSRTAARTAAPSSAATQRGNAKEFVCPYHQWSYDLKGNLQGVPFKRGLKARTAACRRTSGTRTMACASSTSPRSTAWSSRRSRDDIEPIEEYLGPEILKDFDVVFKGRKLQDPRLLPQRAARQLEALSREPQGPVPRDAAALLPGDVRPAWSRATSPR